MNLAKFFIILSTIFVSGFYTSASAMDVHVESFKIYVQMKDVTLRRAAVQLMCTMPSNFGDEIKFSHASVFVTPTKPGSTTYLWQFPRLGLSSWFFDFKNCKYTMLVEVFDNKERLKTFVEMMEEPKYPFADSKLLSQRIHDHLNFMRIDAKGLGIK